MTDLYKYTNVKELKIKHFNTNNKIYVNKETINDKYGFLILYTPTCVHCINNVYVFGQLSSSFPKFNIFAYNLHDNDNRNYEIYDYLKIDSVPKLFYITKNGTLEKYKGKLNYDELFFFICKKLKV